MLHLPYTAWHLSYVVIGASLAPHVDLTRLVATLLAFFLAVGIAAHALDELHGRPLRTQIPTAVLVRSAWRPRPARVALGVVGLSGSGWPLIPFMVVGPFLVVGLQPGAVRRGRPHRRRLRRRLGRLPGADRLRGPDRPAVDRRRPGRRRPPSPCRGAQRRLEHPGPVRPPPGDLVRGPHDDGRRTQSVAIDERSLLAPLERALRAHVVGASCPAGVAGGARWREVPWACLDSPRRQDSDENGRR